MIGISDTDSRTHIPVDYAIGRVVRHRVYGYRGVIVGIDSECKASSLWYAAAKTQPKRDQPWYHVLVHDSGGVSTYVAQSNLEADSSGQKVDHPRISRYFCAFRNGRYEPHAERKTPPAAP